MFGLSDDIIFNKNIIKIIIGIAGASKSSTIHYYFSEKGVEYYRLTSTQKLKRDALERFGGNVETIASGLFHNKDDFYESEKNCEFEIIVIDEILQTTSKVIQYCIDNVGEKNIFITTDICQMLSVGEKSKIMQSFKSLMNMDFCKVVELSYSYRAVNEQTRNLYNLLYKKVDSKTYMFPFIKDMFPSMSYDDMEYNSTDIFIVHTNEIEKDLYSRFHLFNRYDLELLNKGSIAKKLPKNIGSYPILPQLMVRDDLSGYFQISNIATATRFQGSEVLQNQRLFFIVSKDGFISNRELYTVVTRCKDIKSLTIVVYDKKQPTFDTFCGKVIKDEVVFNANDFVFSNGEKLIDIAKGTNEKKIELPLEKMREIQSSMVKLDDDFKVYNDDFIFCGGKLVTVRKEKNEEQEEIEENKKKITIQSLLKKEPQLSYSCIEQVYQLVADVSKRNTGEYTDKLYTPTPISRPADKWKGDFKYSVDLYSAYPTLLKFCDIPIDSGFSTKEKGMLNFYYYKQNPFDSDYLRDFDIITDSMNEYILKNNLGNTEFLFSIDCNRGCKIGDITYEKSFKDKESKEEIKEIRWGYLQTSFYTLSDDTKYYIRRRHNNHELLLIHIKSELSLLIRQITDSMGKDHDDVFFNTDEVLFNGNINDVMKVIDFLTAKDGFHFRIKNNEEHKIIYKSYQELKDKKEKERLKKRKQREQVYMKAPIGKSVWEE